jgi:hypothetical protein
MKRNHLRTIGVNLAVLIGLIIALDFLSISVFEARNLLKRSGEGKDDMLERMPRMPAFEGVPWIEEHVRDVKGETSSYVSFIGWRRNPMRSGTVNIDSSGVRFSFRHPSTGPTAVKAAFLGGSTMWGTGSPDSLTIPSHFNRLGGGRYDAVNYGESSYNAYQGYQFLLRRVLEGHRPDLVVSYDGVNNSPTICPRPFAHARETQIARLLRGADRPERDELTFKGHYLKPTLELMRKFAVATGIANRDTLPGETAGSERPPMSDAEAAKYLLDSWMATFGLAERVGARFLCVLQPNVRVGKPELNHLREEEKGPFTYTFYDDVLSLMETEPYRVLKPHFLDLRDAYDGVPKLYFDFCHVHPKGNQIIAQRILERLEAARPVQAIESYRNP